MTDAMKIQRTDVFHEVTVTAPISFERVADLLVGAFEGGSNYWYEVEGYVEPEADELDRIRAAKLGWSTDLPRYVLYPLTRTGGVLISDQLGSDRHVWLLDEEAIRRGLEVMAQQYPKHMNDVIFENDDADTSDLLLQLALFGEVVFS